MKLRFNVMTLLILGVIASWFLISGNSATAITAGELQNLRVIGHYFTTEISTGRRTIYTKDPSKGRYIVLKLSATIQKDDAVVFAPDFVLRYSHRNGREDCADCDAIAKAKTEASGEFGRFYAASVPRITINSGEVYFGLAFWIESDVETIELYRIGVTEPLTYYIGSDRLYSVSIYTNGDSNPLSETKKVIQQGGFQVVDASDTLVKEETGVTIHYAEKAESQAREISQRLMTAFGIIPTVKKMELISEVDIIVWLGK